MNNISIELSKQEFIGGDTVEGEVLVQLGRETRFRGIRLRFWGYEKSSWTEGSGKHRRIRSEKRRLFDEEVTFAGRPRLELGELMADSLKGVFSRQDYPVLPAGTYRYPFSFVLPPGLPGSYESALTNSEIWYGLRAQVDLPLKFDLKAKRPLVVREPAPAAAAPVTERRTKRFLLDADAWVEAAVHLQEDTFPVGGVLPCQIEVMNRAPRKDIRAVTLVLRQIETLAAEGRTHERKSEVANCRFEPCRFPLKERASMKLRLRLPRDLYPTISGGTLVKLDYELLARLDIPWAVDAKLCVPVRLVAHGQRAGQDP